MRHKMTEELDSGISIALDIPVHDPTLYGNSAIDAILLFLSRHRFEQFSQRALASHTDNAEATVRRGVDILAENDLVVTEYEGNRKLVRINRERLSVPDDPFLRIPQADFQAPVKQAVEALTDALEGVIGILLYGSVARGEADRRSDIDLWVAVRENRAANQRRANTVTADLEDREFDGTRYAFDIAVESLPAIPAFTDDIGAIVRTGIPVYETDAFETLQTVLLEESADE